MLFYAIIQLTALDLQLLHAAVLKYDPTFDLLLDSI